MTPLAAPPLAARPEPALAVHADAPPLSVVVPSHNRCGPLRELLLALSAQSYPADKFEVVVGLDGSTDGSAEMVRSLDLPYRVAISVHENRGAATARNRGVASATNPIIVFLDDDIAPDVDFLAEHARSHAASSSRHAALGYCPPVINATGMWPTTLRNWWSDHFYRKAQPDHKWTHVDLTIGNMSLSRKTYLEAGGLDEAFRRREDWEFAVRLLEHGVPLVYAPRAVGWHHIDTRFETRLRQTRQEARDDVLFARRHPDVRGQLMLGDLAQRLAAGSSGLTLAYGHPRAGATLAAGAVRMLAVLERLQLRRQWLRLAQTLVGHAYLRGVADEFPSPEEFVAFFAPSWRDERPTVALSLNRPLPPTRLPPAGIVDVEVSLDDRAVARFPLLEHEQQWEWRRIEERILNEVSWPLMEAFVRNQLSARGGVEAALEELEVLALAR